MNGENKNNNQRSVPPRTSPSGQRTPQNRINSTHSAQKPPQNGQKPPQSRVSPPQSGQRPPARRPVPGDKAPEQPPRRRNEESYVFSRSLSETQERILQERRERLEDARRFRREDVKDKLIKGSIAFGITLVLMITIAAIIISASLGSGQVKKGKGEFVFKIGENSTRLAYADTVHDGMIYISMNSVAELCELTLSGNASNDLRFYTKDGGWISFAPQSKNATINGYGIQMPAEARINGTECSVPLEFLEAVLDGVEITVDTSEKNTVTVKRSEYPDSTPLEPHYLDVGFMLKVSGAMSALDENKYFAGKPLFDFKVDLSDYEQYMNPDNDYFLLLINKEIPIDSEFEPQGIVEIPSKWVNPDKVRDGITLDLNYTASMALEAMLLEMRAAGFTKIYATSAYRSYNYQSGLYNTYIQKETAANPYLSSEEIKAIVESYSAVPGTSEHHTGLCVDLISTDMIELTNDFADKEVFDWLCANAWKFGFVLRYPEDKIDVTGYAYESWHWRFVGRSHALSMLRTGMCLEDYTASLIQH